MSRQAFLHLLVIYFGIINKVFGSMIDLAAFPDKDKFWGLNLKHETSLIDIDSSDNIERNESLGLEAQWGVVYLRKHFISFNLPYQISRYNSVASKESEISSIAFRSPRINYKFRHIKQNIIYDFGLSFKYSLLKEEVGTAINSENYGAGKEARLSFELMEKDKKLQYKFEAFIKHHFEKDELSFSNRENIITSSFYEAQFGYAIQYALRRSEFIGIGLAINLTQDAYIETPDESTSYKLQVGTTSVKELFFRKKVEKTFLELRYKLRLSDYRSQFKDFNNHGDRSVNTIELSAITEY